MYSFFCKSEKILKKINGMFRTLNISPYFCNAVIFMIFVRVICFVIIFDIVCYEGTKFKESSSNGIFFQHIEGGSRFVHNPATNRRIHTGIPQRDFLSDGSPEFITSNLSSVLFLDFKSLAFAEEVLDQKNNKCCEKASHIAKDRIDVHSFFLGLITGLILYLLIYL